MKPRAPPPEGNARQRRAKPFVEVLTGRERRFRARFVSYRIRLYSVFRLYPSIQQALTLYRLKTGRPGCTIDLPVPCAGIFYSSFSAQAIAGEPTARMPQDGQRGSAHSKTVTYQLPGAWLLTLRIALAFGRCRRGETCPYANELLELMLVLQRGGHASIGRYGAQASR